MRPVHAIVLKPNLNRDPDPGLPYIPEPVFIQTFIPAFAIVAFNQRVLSRVPFVNKMDIQMVFISPLNKCLRYKFRPIINNDLTRQCPRPLNPVHQTNQPYSRDRKVSMAENRLSSKIIDYIQYPESPTIVERIAHKIHGPPLVSPRRQYNRLLNEHPCPFLLFPSVFQIENRI